MRPLLLLVVLAASIRIEARAIRFHQIAPASDTSDHAGRVSDSTQSPGGKTWRAPTKAGIFVELESRT
ncbi:hypothetical protein [Burkholderia sp.]|uniref:hypothetical protein n=1 Tax=Burkholderia sp. TaxID=36773 RepID=UPI00258B7F93|nr:hypothetical protein [Burkholderia sp.]MCL4634658.1 hypothetical protein [Burkholderia sp.]